jgi:hypothetical protein
MEMHMTWALEMFGQDLAVALEMMRIKLALIA